MKKKPEVPLLLRCFKNAGERLSLFMIIIVIITNTQFYTYTTFIAIDYRSIIALAFFFRLSSQ